MALREIGAKLTLDGEAEWNKQMKAADRELANLKSELAATSAEFFGQANTVEALRAKQQLQAQQAAQQREKVKALADAVADATEKWGAESTQVDKLTKEYNYARASLANMEANLDETSDLLDEAEASADGCAASIDQYGKKVKAAAAPTEKTAGKVEDLADAEKDAKGGASGLLAGLQKLVPQLGLAQKAASLTAAGFAGAAVKGFKQAFDWAMNLVESTAELRQQLTQLETAVGAAGMTMDSDLTDAMRVVYEASGDMNTSIQTVSELLQAGYTSGGMVDVLEQLRGAVIAFPDTLKIDSLAEGLQKTLSTGAADGQFKDMLERLGIDTADFAASLAACTTSAERQQVVIDALAGSELADLTAVYDDASASSIALSDANFDLEMANARLADSFEPVAAKLAEVKASWAGFAASMLDARALGGSIGDLLGLGFSSGKAAGAEKGLSTEEILTTMQTAGLTFDDVASKAMAAGQSVGEFINALHADQVEEAAAAAEEFAAQEAAEAEAAAAAAAAQEAHRYGLEVTNDRVQDAVGRLAELQATYESIRAGIDSVATGFADLSAATDQYETSAGDMIDSLQSQIDYMNEYAANLQAAKDMGLSDALVEELSDGSAQSAAYLEAIVADGGESIEELNAKFAEVETGKQAFVDTVAEALPGFQETIAEITTTLNDAVDDWNQNEAAQAAGADTIEGLMTGLDRYDEIFALGQQMGQAFTAGYNQAMDIHSPSGVMAKAMDYTVAGALIEGRRQLPVMQDMGGSMGDSLLRGYRRASDGAAAILRAETAGSSGGAQNADSDVVALLKALLRSDRAVVLEDGTIVGRWTERIDAALGAAV